MMGRGVGNWVLKSAYLSVVRRVWVRIVQSSTMSVVVVDGVLENCLKTQAVRVKNE
jgi:hypothetical protein